MSPVMPTDVSGGTPVSTALIWGFILFTCLAIASDFPMVLPMDHGSINNDDAFAVFRNFIDRYVFTPAKCLLAWESGAEALAGSILLHRFRVCEHMWGSRHFVFFVIVVRIVEIVGVVSFGAVVAEMGGILPDGTPAEWTKHLPIHTCAIAPSSLCCALLTRFLIETPVRAKFKVLGVTMSNKALEIVLMAQILGYSFPSSVILVIPSILASFAFVGNVVGLRTAAIPQSVWNCCSRCSCSGWRIVFSSSAWWNSILRTWRELDLRNTGMEPLDTEMESRASHGGRGPGGPVGQLRRPGDGDEVVAIDLPAGQAPHTGSAIVPQRILESDESVDLHAALRLSMMDVTNQQLIHHHHHRDPQRSGSS
jgi:hypothetical protein